MNNLSGLYECKVDEKGRVILPSALKKQFPPEIEGRFYINMGFGSYLVLYPINVWNVIVNEINKFNLFDEDNREVVRYVYNGATPLTLDNNNRLLLPKILLDHGKIKNEVILYAFSYQVEVWSKELYIEMVKNPPKDIKQKAKESLGHLKFSF